jgi:hypothetical protein
MAAVTAAVGGLVISGVSAGMSFSQANKQKKAQQRAEEEADRAMEAARGKLDVNFAEQMSIKKEAYDLEREAMLSAGAQATEAGRESERGSAATAGRVYAAQQKGQQGIRGAMADEMTNIENAIIEEDSRLRDLDVALDLEEVAGNQQAAADAQRAAQVAKQQGVQSTLAFAQQGLAMAPLYSKNTAAQKSAMGAAQGSEKTATAADVKAGRAKNIGDKFSTNPYAGKKVPTKDSNMFNKRQQDYFGKDIGALDFNSMSNRDFRAFNRAVGNEMQFDLRSNPQYIQSYQDQMNQPVTNYFGYNPGN